MTTITTVFGSVVGDGEFVLGTNDIGLIYQSFFEFDTSKIPEEDADAVSVVNLAVILRNGAR